MKHLQKLILAVSIIILTSIKTNAYQEFINTNYEGHDVKVIKVVLDGNHYVVTSVNERGGESLSSLMNKVGGVSAVNGAFFCPDDYPQCGGVSHTNADRIFMGNGARYSKWRDDTGTRGILGFLKSGEPIFVQNNHGYVPGYKGNKNANRIKELYFGIGNFPILLVNGQSVVNYYSNDMSAKIAGIGTKGFICYTKDKGTIYMGFVSNILAYQLPNFIKKHFGCYDAILRDAGGSAGIIYDGTVLKKSGRKIMDARVVVTKDQYIKHFGYAPSWKVKYSNLDTANNSSSSATNSDLPPKYQKFLSIFKNYIYSHTEKVSSLQHFLERIKDKVTDSTKKLFIQKLLEIIYLYQAQQDLNFDNDMNLLDD